MGAWFAHRLNVGVSQAATQFRDRDVSAACVVAGTVHAVLFFVAALGFAAFGWTRLAVCAAWMALLMWIASLAQWGIARLAERYLGARR